MNYMIDINMEINFETLKETRYNLVFVYFLKAAPYKKNNEPFETMGKCLISTSLLTIVILFFTLFSNRLMMGFMIVSSFLSMWISNTATTAMMLPIAQAVLQQLKATEIQAEEREIGAMAEDNHGFELEISQTTDGKTHDTKPQLNDDQRE